MRYNEFKINLLEAILDEVEMSPRALKDFLASPESQGMKMGFELEMCVIGARRSEDYDESEPDYGYDEPTSDIDNITNFFDDGEYNGREDIRILRNQLYDSYLEWQDGAFDDYMDSEEGTKEFEEELRGVINYDVDEKAQEAAYKDIVANRKTKQFANEINENVFMTVMETLRDQFNDSEDGSQEAWLDFEGWNYMTDIENEFSVTWPHWSYGESEESIDVDWVADDFSEKTGLKAYGYDGYHSGSRSMQAEKGNWIIEPDSSIDPGDDEDAGLEFVSPALDLPEAFDQLKKALAWAEDTCYTNRSTGLHINVSVPGMTEETTDYVKLALFLGDKHILEQFDRLSNTYCRSALDKISNRAKKAKPEEMSNIMATLRQGLNAEASKLVHGWSTDKYTSINTKRNYVEFRGPGGDYLKTDVEKLVNTALRTAYALKIASDPNAYKKEYMKKFYKVITDEKQKDDVQKFNQYIAMYQAGDKDERQKVLTYIRNNIEFRRELKKEVPTKEKESWWVMNRDGTGGKQMVFARSKAEAIDIGGSNMGYNQDYSRANLTAVKKTDTLRRYTITNKYDASQSVEILAQDMDSAVVIGADKLGVSANDVRAISSDTSQDGREEIAYEIKNRDTGATLERIPASLNLTPQEVEARRQHWARETNLPDHVIVIDPPLAQDLPQVGTPEPENAEEIYQSLPDGFKSYLDGIGDETPAAIQATIDRLLAPGVQHLNDEQRQLAISRMQAELRRRRFAEPNPNDIARSMPERWKDWILTSLPHLNRGTLQSVYERLRDSPQSDTDIDRVQRTWLMHRIQQEIDFRNGADSQAQEPEPTASPQRIYRVWDTRPGGDSWVYPADSAEAALLRVKRQQGVPEQYLAVEETDILVPNQETEPQES